MENKTPDYIAGRTEQLQDLLDFIKSETQYNPEKRMIDAVIIIEFINKYVRANVSLTSDLLQQSPVQTNRN